MRKALQTAKVKLFCHSINSKKIYKTGGIVMSSISDFFGCMVFNDRVMKATLSAEVYTSLRKTMDEGAPLESGVANAVATAMKDWAIEKGATHFTHWFQPLTGITAEKHDCFITPAPDGGVIMECPEKS